jgi:hypothetical protein
MSSEHLQIDTSCFILGKTVAIHGYMCQGYSVETSKISVGIDQ